MTTETEVHQADIAAELATAQELLASITRKRPFGCEKLPVLALDQGIITSLANVEVNAELIQQLR